MKSSYFLPSNSEPDDSSCPPAPMAALVRSLMSFCLFKFAFDERFRWIFFPILDLYLWRLLPRLAFMVTARVALKGLWVSFTYFVATTKPLDSSGWQAREGSLARYFPPSWLNRSPPRHSSWRHQSWQRRWCWRQRRRASWQKRCCPAALTATGGSCQACEGKVKT